MHRATFVGLPVIFASVFLADKTSQVCLAERTFSKFRFLLLDDWRREPGRRGYVSLWQPANYNFATHSRS